ncbi:phage tail assembly chaperone G [Paenibacillus apiarius]|uniref:phage tail assembly chaperone G n=1 Tax=Paenibacillus apiarius TaxID=46240 RepID=UPI003B3B208E
MDVTLRMEDGKTKEFSQGFISGRMFRRTLEISKALQGGTIDENTADVMADYVVDLFGKQFSREQFYDGIDARLFIPTVTSCVQKVIGEATEAVGAETNDPN